MKWKHKLYFSLSCLIPLTFTWIIFFLNNKLLTFIMLEAMLLVPLGCVLYIVGLHIIEKLE